MYVSCQRWLSAVSFALLVCLGCLGTDTQVLAQAKPSNEPIGVPRKAAKPRKSVAPRALDKPGHGEPATSSSAKEGSMLRDKPYLTLRIESEATIYQVCVNGAFVSTELEGQASSIALPINHFMRSGKNEISVEVVPWELEDGKRGFEANDNITLKLLVQSATALEIPGVEIATLSFRGARMGSPEATAASTAAGRLDSAKKFARVSDGDVILGPVESRTVGDGGQLLVSRSITLPLPFLEWDFFRSDTVPQRRTLDAAQRAVAREELLQQYEVVWNALRTKNVESIMPLFEERNRETDAAMYFLPGTTERRLRAAFQSMFKDSNRELEPIRSDGVTWDYDVGPTGKLMRLTWGTHANGIITYKHKTIEGLRTEFAIVYRKQGDRYIISR